MMQCESAALAFIHEPPTPSQQAYWGSKWRFKLFDGLYTHPMDPAVGKIVDVDRRFAHLQERLNAAQKGEDVWVNKLFESDEDVMKEVKDPKVVQEYCKIWLSVLNERAREIDEARNVSTTSMIDCAN